MRILKLIALEHKYAYPNNGDEIVNDIKGYVSGDSSDESQHENQHSREKGSLDEIEEETDRDYEEEDTDEESDEDKELEKIKRHKDKKKDVFEPHPFYESQYGYTGFEGAYTSPLEYYSGSISEEPGAITNNPYNNPYQSSSTSNVRASRIERIIIRAMIFNDMIAVNN